MSTTTRRPATGTVAHPVPPSTAHSLWTIVRHGLHDNRRAPLTWGGSLGLMSALIAAIWPSIEDSITQLMENYPPNLKAAFGIQTLDTVEKYVDAEMLSLVVPLAVAVFAVLCATRATVGAEDRGHLDTLLSLPLSRRVLVAGSVIVTAIATAAILFVVWALTWLVGTMVGTDISAVILGRGVLNVWPLSMAFAGLAVFAAGLVRRPAVVTAIATGTLLGMYVIDLVGKLSPSVESLRTFSAFRYYGSAVQNGLDVSHVLGLTLCGLVLSIAGALLFERRDVR